MKHMKVLLFQKEFFSMIWESSQVIDGNDVLKKEVKQYGVRNSLLLAPMPTASQPRFWGIMNVLSLTLRMFIRGEFYLVSLLFNNTCLRPC